MIKIENTYVTGWESAIRGMRNPMNSWGKSDSIFEIEYPDIRAPFPEGYNVYGHTVVVSDEDLLDKWDGYPTILGPNDYKLCEQLAEAGTTHSKWRRMVVVYADITAPLYWWKEFDTYKIGTVANSCSTMHKIAAKEFEWEDFSHEHLDDGEGLETLNSVVNALNRARDLYLETKDKRYWWQMIQLLPSSYNQKRTVMMNYEVLAGIYATREGHKLDEWHDFRKWIWTLPYSELMGTVKFKEK